MAKKRKNSASLAENFYNDLTDSPEWAGLRISGRIHLLYLTALSAGLFLCICTLYVLLS